MKAIEKSIIKSSTNESPSFNMARKIFPKDSKRENILINILFRLDDYNVPRNISKKFISSTNLSIIKSSLERNYFTDVQYLRSPLGQIDLLNHLIRRLENFRRTAIPWLDEAKKLDGARILEIGCGTGSSTVALVEQGAHVTAVDISDSSIIVAKDRCKAYGLEAKFVIANATEVCELLNNEVFDFIIFWASLEHMTQEERIDSIKSTWQMLPLGGLWCLIETPNRLWYWDTHTSQLPFFMWLPDDLAKKYSAFSPREFFNASQEKRDMQDFLRSGRGVSFHEFQLALGAQINVVSSANFARRNLLWRIRWRLSIDHKYESILSRICPNIHKGFFQPTLNLIIKK
jgi:2-polyprenyl-3-methyl-5-hydroxy-6-metoxy-1,4-benzoquinol methylase